METRNQYTVDSTEINQVLDVIAIKRMARAGKVSMMSHHPFEFSNTLQMFRLKRVLSINITLFPNRKWNCIGCILRNVRGARLVQVSSLRKATVFTSNIEKRLKCPSCSNIMLLNQDECQKYRQKTNVNIETYPKLSGNNRLDQLRSNCMVLFYARSYQVRCIKCMKNSFATNKDPYILTRTSSLVDTSKLHPELTTSSFQKLLGCHNRRKCIRLQKVPDNFCSDHAFFLSLESSPSIPRADVTKKQRNIVQWMFGPLKAPYSHVTIRNRTPIRNVFFAYNVEPASAGYVWMRQTSRNLGIHCMSANRS
ncbi:unnamed protein product [Albugo candida]|uniref:Uncharacterized protein n=1 Tax=Albugo candida TaxID=65357 RepID=A0A024FW54_9STRA|nr:unnamed protein product [Albugo candida]|eukprot:CCI11137.1 unnamed protein product [Albugo candida]